MTETLDTSIRTGVGGGGGGGGEGEGEEAGGKGGGGSENVEGGGGDMEEAGRRRTREEVEASAKAAGLNLSTSQGSELLSFSSQLNSDEVCLMEMPLEILDSLKIGETVVIRGEVTEEAVLCTNGLTYEFRSADTSNALLLVPSLSYPLDTEHGDLEPGDLPVKEVTACLSSYYEVRTCRPRTEKLKTLLAECPYRGPEYEEEDEEEEEEEQEEEEGEEEMRRPSRNRRGVENKRKKYTFSELLDVVQASEAELCDSLDSMQACLIDGYWRVLDIDYRDQAIQHILTMLEEHDWDWRDTPLNAICGYLTELEPSFVIEHCLKCYGNEKDNANNLDKDETYYELSEIKICQFYAELLLRQAGKFNYHEFMESWQQSVPYGMQTNLEQLKGLALSDINSMPPVIWYFPLSNLPQDPVQRFNHLFSVRERWTDCDMLPYIQDLATPTQSLNALLLKHTRVSTGVKGQKVYNAKRTTPSFK